MDGEGDIGQMIKEQLAEASVGLCLCLKLRDVLVFVCLDKDAQDVHQ
jgi:hypothetical protein